jgi:hypothetical protein
MSLFEPLNFGSKFIAVFLIISSLPYLAIGEGLWLVAEIADETNRLRRGMASLLDDSTQTREYLAAFVRKINPPKIAA